MHHALSRLLVLFAPALFAGCAGSSNAERYKSDSARQFPKPDIMVMQVGENRSTDSVAAIIAGLPDDTAKATAIYWLAQELLEKDTVACRTYTNYLLWLSQELKYQKGQAQGYYIMGRLREDHNSIEDAVDYFKLSAAYSAAADYDEGLLKSYYWLARCYRRLGDYPAYNEYLSHLEHLALQLNNKAYLSYAYEGYGNLYRNLGDYAQSISYYEKAILLADTLGELEQKSTALNNMSLVYEYEDNQEEELRIQLRNYEVIQKMESKALLVLCLSNLSATYDMLGMEEPSRDAIAESIQVLNALPDGEVDEKDKASAYGQFAWISWQSGNTDTALVYYLKALQISEEIKDRKSVSEYNGRLGGLYTAMGMNDSAESHFLRKLRTAREINFSKGEIDAYDALAELKFKAGDFSEAYLLQRNSDILRDSLLLAATSSRATEMETWNKVREQQQQISMLSQDQELQNLELEKRNTIAYALAGGFLLVLLLFFVIFRNYKQNRRRNAELEREVGIRTLALSRRNRDLKNFIYRSSHDLRSPIASIKGLINITRTSVSDPEVKLYLDKIETVINRQDATLTALLKVSRLIEGKIAVEKINVSELLEEITSQVYSPEQREYVEVSYIADPRLTINSDRVVLTSILQNLVSNGVKYRRRRSMERSFVKITAAPLDNGVQFTVTDNGEGIPGEWHDKIFDMFSRGSSTGEGSGLGLYLVLNSVETLKGKLNFESTFGEGSVFTAWLPDKEEATAAPQPRVEYIS